MTTSISTETLWNYIKDIYSIDAHWLDESSKKNSDLNSSRELYIFLYLLMPDRQTNGQNIQIIDVHCAEKSLQKKNYTSILNNRRVIDISIF